jgi:hypothetical protein
MRPPDRLVGFPDIEQETMFNLNAVLRYFIKCALCAYCMFREERSTFAVRCVRMKMLFRINIQVPRRL